MGRRKVIVVGAGPAGMMAAGQAALLGAEAVLLEGMGRPGRKLLLTGGGRCNIGNTAPREEFVRRFGREGRFLYPALSAFFTEESFAFFAELGLPLKADEAGRVYPLTGRAPDVLRVLRGWLAEVGVSFVPNTEVRSLLMKEGRLRGVLAAMGSRGKDAGSGSRQELREYEADAVILATGGASYPATGSTGIGYDLARGAGHTVKPIRPALVPLVSPDGICRRLQGLALDDVELTVRVEGKRKGVLRGAMLFTHFGVSGPAVLTLSGGVVDALREGRTPELLINLVPDLDERGLDETLRTEAAARGRQGVRTVLGQWLPDRMAVACCERAEIPPGRKGGELTGAERRRLAKHMAALRIGISGYRSLKEAMVTAGGVALREIDPKTMMSRLVKSLYFAGEVIDLHGDTGGFNLQAALSTGRLAGRSAAAGCSPGDSP